MTDAVQAAFIGAIVGAAVSALGALLTTVITLRNSDKRRKAEDRRWYAEYFLSRKIDALSKLYSSLVVANSAVLESISLSIAEEPEKLSQYLETLKKALERFKADKGLSWVYLDGDERASLNDVDWEFSYVLEVILNYSPKKVAESFTTERFSQMDDSYDSAQATMEKLLSPDVLKGIEPEE